jgi:hypothetical protein
MAKKRKKPTIKKRITRALKKFVRANPKRIHAQKDFYILKIGSGQGATYEVRRSGSGVMEDYTDNLYAARKSARELQKAEKDRPTSLAPGSWFDSRANPRRVKGAKVAGGRAVSLRNFTGRVIRKRDGTVQILGRTRR